MAFKAKDEYGNQIRKGDRIGTGRSAVTFDSVVSPSLIMVVTAQGDKVTVVSTKLEITIS